MNPLMLKAAPYVIAAALAFGLAWWIQGLRITSAEQEFTSYKQKQAQIIQEAKDEADKQRLAEGKKYDDMAKGLADEIAKGEVFKRCVAAGKCGRMSNVPSGSGIRLPAASRVDGDSTNAVPLAGESAEEGAQAVNDCAVTTLMLNRLQSGIEGQPGYAP